MSRRRYLGLDVLARFRITPANDQNTQEATDPTTPPALTASHTTTVDSTEHADLARHLALVVNELLTAGALPPSGRPTE